VLKAAIIGFGGMGRVHARAYARRADVALVAVADERQERLDGKAVEMNIGSTGAADMAAVRAYRSGDEMLRNEKPDVVSVCVPTDLHAEFSIRAMEAGAHVLCEKPMSRTLEGADGMIAARDRTGRVLMVAQCLRFWPAYERLAECVRSGEHGKLLMLSMRRVSAPPGWSGPGTWFTDGRRSGGCLLDMHIHDTDLVNHLFGVPAAVVTAGSSCVSGAVDNSFTQYLYDGGPLVMAEASWCRAGEFRMSFDAVFERASLELGAGGALTLTLLGQEPAAVALPEGNGYAREIEYFLACAAEGRAPQRCLPESTRDTMRIALAEEQSALAGGARIALR
jgi:predicted dehydrogenase